MIWCIPYYKNNHSDLECPVLQEYPFWHRKVMLQEYPLWLGVFSVTRISLRICLGLFNVTKISILTCTVLCYKNMTSAFRFSEFQEYVFWLDVEKYFWWFGILDSKIKWNAYFDYCVVFGICMYNILTNRSVVNII